MSSNRNAILRKWAREDDGAIAILFAFTLVIAAGVTGTAIDYARALSDQTAMQQSADAAAISAASLQGADTAKIAIAKATFNANYNTGKHASATPSVAIVGRKVTVSAVTSVPTTLAALLGVSSIDITGTASASSKQPARACILTLDPHGDAAFLIQGTSDLIVTDCSVRVNSDHSTAISGNGTPSASATSTSTEIEATFCAMGGTYGKDLFDPEPDHGCLNVVDDYVGVATPVSYDCTSTKKKLHKGKHTLHATPDPDNDETKIDNVFCEGLTILAGADVTFEKGTYFIKDGELSIRGGASVRGDGVVFVFVGEGATLNINGGADADLTAPMKGEELGGFLFFQDRASSAGSSSIITGGGYLKMNGLAYFPTQTLEVRGNGRINQDADMWAIIAYRFRMTGTGDMLVTGNAEYARLPDLVPIAPGNVVLH